jgi:hypothetical protein
MELSLLYSIEWTPGTAKCLDFELAGGCARAMPSAF